MNYRMIAYLLGVIILIEAAFLLLPLLVALIYGEASGVWFLLTLAGAAVLGFLLTLLKPTNRTMYAREGFVITALTWIVISLIGAAPFTLSGQIPNYLDAVFEMVSGFTTTGASIVPNVEKLDRCMNFWRCLSHWLGGMGILVFMLAIVNLGGGQSNHLLRAESPGPTVGKLLPNMRHSSAILYGIYIFLIVLLSIGLKWRNTISVNSVIGIHFLTTRDFSVGFIWNEFQLVLIGIVVAFVINLFQHNRYHQNRLVSKKKETEANLQMILGELGRYLRHQERKEDVWADISHLENTLKNLVLDASEYEGNTFHKHTGYYMDYFEMRLEQCNVLEDLHLEVNKIREMPVEAAIIADFVDELIDNITEGKTSHFVPCIGRIGSLFVA